MALAFVPMAFVTGMMGPYMGPIPFFVPAALFASLVISVTLNPFLAFLLTSRHDPEPGKRPGKNVFVRMLENVEAAYARFLSALLYSRAKRRTALALIAFTLLASLALPLSPLVPFRMLPKADKEQFYLYLDMPDGTDARATDTAARELERTLLEDPEVLAVESFVGTAPVVDFNGLFKGSSGRVAEYQATLRTDLTHPADRIETSEAIAFRVRERLAPFGQRHPDAALRIVEDPPGPPVLSTFLLKVKGGDDETRERIARDLAAETAGIAGIVDQDVSVPERGLDYAYRIDAEKASLLGVSPAEASASLRTAFSGANVGLYREAARPGLRKAEQEYVVVRFSGNDRSQERDLGSVKLRNRSGGLVSLAEVAVREDRAIETLLITDGREKTTFVSAEMGDRSVIYAVLDLFPKLLDYRLPDGQGQVVSWSPLGITYEDPATGSRYAVEIGGEWKLTLEVFRDLGLAMGAAIFLIFFVLAARTRSLLVPALILVSVPLGLIGVLPGFALLYALKGTYFNATSMIGVIALSGLSVKNAVIYLEYLEPLKEAGRPLREALVEAGRIRLLPIVLTSLAAVLGSLTIVSDPVWEGLAWAIIFGLSASTALTLIVFPILYFLFERKSWGPKETT
jgi:multidrug efflux pump subunit AcrB